MILIFDTYKHKLGIYIYIYVYCATSLIPLFLIAIIVRLKRSSLIKSHIFSLFIRQFR